MWLTTAEPEEDLPRLVMWRVQWPTRGSSVMEVMSSCGHLGAAELQVMEW